MVILGHQTFRSKLQQENININPHNITGQQTKSTRLAQTNLELGYFKGCKAVVKRGSLPQIALVYRLWHGASRPSRATSSGGNGTEGTSCKHGRHVVNQIMPRPDKHSHIHVTYTCTSTSTQLFHSLLTFSHFHKDHTNNLLCLTLANVPFEIPTRIKLKLIFEEGL